jgi:hypothetical protein
MKTKLFLMILTLTFFTMSCEKVTLENMSVKKYINLLKTESYDFMELPPFDSKDIPELLTYASDDQILNSYPHNPVSSLFVQECRLGVYVLWTVESIRKSSIDEKTSFGRFPSLNPILSLKTNSDGTFDPDKSHQETAQAYLDWWNSSDDFEQIKNINPLDGTDYVWR